MTNTHDDMPRDPDTADVPAELAEHDGEMIWVNGEPATLTINPGLFGHSRRLRERFYDEDGTR